MYIKDSEVRNALVAQMKKDGMISDLKVNSKTGEVTYTWGR
jgi:hypothetical protein